MAVSFNNSTRPPISDKLPDGLYSIVVQDLDVPKSFGAMPKSIEISGASLSGEDIRLSRTGIIKGKIALQSRLADGTTGPFLLVSNNNLHLLPSGFKVEAKANPWFQGGHRVSKGRLCGPTGCQVMELDANDQFIIEDLLPGTYDLKLWSQNLAEKLLSGGMALIPEVLPAVKVEEGRLTDVGTVNIQAAVQLRGTVRDSRLAPVHRSRRASKRGGRDRKRSYS